MGVLEVHIESTISEAKKRQQCYLGALSQCTPLVPPFVKSEENQTTTETVAVSPPESVTRNLELLTRHYEADSAQTRIDQTSPIFVLDESRCFSGGERVYFYPRWMRAGSSEAFYITYLNKIYVHDLNGATGNAYYDALTELGVRFLYQPPTNYYMCPDIAFDEAEVATLYVIRTALGEEALIRELTQEQIDALSLEEAAMLEERIISAEIVTPELVSDYLSILSDLLHIHSEVGLARTLGANTVKKIEMVLLMYDQKSANFHEMVWNAVRTNSVIRPVTQHGAEMPLASVFVTRGFTPVLLLQSNRSFISEPVYYLDRPAFDHMHPTLVSYEDALRSLPGPDAFLEAVEHGRSADYLLRGESP
jgi:hypothetical protein